MGANLGPLLTLRLPPVQAYLQYQIKAAKSDLHSRMRQRLGALRQRLALTKFDQ